MRKPGKEIYQSIIKRHTENVGKGTVIKLGYQKDWHKSLLIALNTLNHTPFVENICSVMLYGSVARGDNTESSDIDIVVFTKETISANHARKIMAAFRDIEPVPVDCHFYIGTLQDIREHYPNDIYFQFVEKEGIELWNK